MKNIGILSLQGNFEDHILVIEKIGHKATKIRNKNQLQNIDGLILPGGESSAIYLLLKQKDMFDEIQRLGRSGLPIFGTCAGCILLCKNIDGSKIVDVKSLDLIDIDVQRNAYGSQIESFFSKMMFFDKEIDTYFIRAPKITRIGEGVKVLSTFNNQPVVAMQNKVLVSTSHPELGQKTDIHEYFVSIL